MFAILTLIISFSLLTMLVLVFGNVVLRYVFNSGITISEEVSRMAFVWLTFAGAVLALRARQHLAINMLLDRFSPQVQKALHIVRQLLILWVLWLLIDGGWEQTVIGVKTVTPVSGLPIAVFSGAVLCSSVLMALMLLCDLYAALRTPATRATAGRFRTSVDTVDDV
ncbi:TRAP transporter small permease subunit [Pusillimonas sp. TS35]|nr:TRAP transporter small permease subunit [Pusillimonas sp. TS35]